MNAALLVTTEYVGGHAVGYLLIIGVYTVSDHFDWAIRLDYWIHLTTKSHPPPPPPPRIDDHQNLLSVPWQFFQNRHLMVSSQLALGRLITPMHRCRKGFGIWEGGGGGKGEPEGAQALP